METQTIGEKAQIYIDEWVISYRFINMKKLNLFKDVIVDIYENNEFYFNFEKTMDDGYEIHYEMNEYLYDLMLYAVGLFLIGLVLSYFEKK